MDQPIFERDGARFVATTMARGPWDPGACHGGAPATLLATLVDEAPSLTPMQCVRLTYEIERPVPIGVPLDADVEVIRDGKRVQVLEATLRTGGETPRMGSGTPLVRCRALRVRTGEVATPVGSAADDAAPAPLPEDLPRFEGLETWDADGFWRAVDLRFVAGMLGDVGPGIAWTRLVSPIADGIETPPVARAAAAGDFGNGIGSPLSMDEFVYINPDLTLYLHRLPVGPWVGMAASSVVQPTGVGLTTSTLFDPAGRIGTASQGLFVDHRPEDAPA